MQLGKLSQNSQLLSLSFLIECQYVVKHLSLNNLPPFYLILLKYWQEYNHDKFSENSDIQNKVIWNNNRILIGGKPIFYMQSEHEYSFHS